MEKLQQFYLSLSTDAELNQQFNAGDTLAAKQANRVQLLLQAGVDKGVAEKVVGLNQEELRQFFAQALASADVAWEKFASAHANSTNSTNSTNKISNLGSSQAN